MDKGTFTAIISRAGRRVTISRGPVSIQPMMASTVGIRDETMLQDATQDDVQVHFTADDFSSTLLIKPNRYDRVIDTDGRSYSIQIVKDMRGLAGELYGYKCLIRGNE